MKNKRGQGLSLNTIIIAAIALIVLVVLVMIFTGRMSVFTGQVSTCANQGGRCMTTTECEQSPAGNEIKASDCALEICCIKP